MHFDQLTVIYFFALVVAIILHEISHGVVAWWFGDDTARRAGRLTLNPVPHIDPFGSIILPALGALSGIPVFGWAKPVPVNPSRMRNPRRDMLVVSLAGPVTNLALMVAAALVARALYHPQRRRLLPDDHAAAARSADRAVVRDREHVPRDLQPPADPAARRLRAARAGAAAGIGCRAGSSSARTACSSSCSSWCRVACPATSSIRSFGTSTRSCCDEPEIRAACTRAPARASRRAVLRVAAHPAARRRDPGVGRRHARAGGAAGLGGDGACRSGRGGRRRPPSR